MNNLCKYFIVKMTVILAVFFTATGSWSAENDQEERIKKMGFVSISEATDEDIEPVKRVPQAKVINIPPKAPNPYIEKTAKSSPKKKSAFKTDNELTASSFVELDDPIYVYGDGQTVVKTPKREIFEVALSDEAVKDSAASIFGNKSSVQKSENVFQAEPAEHIKDAHNYYNYDNVDRNFKRFADNNTSIKTVTLEDLERAEMAEVTNDQYPFKENAVPSINLNYKSEDQKVGIPGIETNTRVTIGYRVDDLDFNIASDLTGTATPNIISELTWSDIQMVEAKAKFDFILLNHFVVDAKAGYGSIIKGDNQDSDYDGDNRTDEFSRSNNSSDDGYVWDYSLAGGLRFYVDNPDPIFLVDKLTVTFLGGYSRHKQDFVIQDGNQTIPDFGPFPGLDSRYRSQWDGPWVGLELSGRTRKNKLRGFGRFEYHFADYVGDGTWNLRDDFVNPRSFEMISDKGRGIVFEGGGDYFINSMWSLSLSLVLQDWEMDPGTVQFFLSNGGTPKQRLNEVNWDSLSITFGATARF